MAMTRRPTAFLTGCLASLALAACGTLPAGSALRPRLDVHAFGARGDGLADDTAALQQALDAASAQNALLVLSPGVYRCGSLTLKSNLAFHLEAGATLQAISGDLDRYPVGAAPWEGPDALAYAAFLHAADAHDIAITGPGTIDGAGQWWWENYARSPVSRPRLVEFLNCRNITLDGLNLRNSPGWNIHPVFSSDITVNRVTITAPPDSHNTDGINPNGCRNVTITGCTIDVGDDCIAIKSGKDLPPDQRRPTENVLIARCTMRRGHGGVTIGSETCGGVRHVRVTDCLFDGTDNGVRLKSKRGRGGADDDILYDHIEMRNVKNVIHITLFYEGRGDGKPRPVDAGTPIMGNITLRNVRALNCDRVGLIEGLPERPISGVRLENVQIFAAAGLEMRDVTDIHCDNVTIHIIVPSERSSPSLANAPR